MFARSERPLSSGRRAGFALPMTLLTLALITAAVVAAFSATAAETVANNAMRAQDHAYQLAEAGLQQFLLRRGEAGFCTNCANNPAVSDSEWTVVSLPGGYARVVASRLRAELSGGTPSLFFIRSTGVDTMTKLSGAGRHVDASRTVGLLATYGTARMKPLGALTSLNGVTNNSTLPGHQIAVEGRDECGTSIIAGAVVPGAGAYFGTGRKPTGSPGVDSTLGLDSLKARVGIDWNAIVNHDAIPPDFTIPSDGWPTSAAFTAWPVVRVKGSLTMPTTGRGVLIVDSNLVIPSNYGWEGIILVGGHLTATGSGTISGAIASGLNRLLAGAPADAGTLDNDEISGRIRIDYNSCRVASAAEKLKVYFAWTNTWIDNVPIW